MLLTDFLNITEKGKRFIRFSNVDGKFWIMPIRNMQTAMHLYQPSGVKGKLVKRLLPFIYWLPMVKRVVHAEMMSIDLQNDISDLLKNIFGIDEFQFSIFEGTPSVHQKITFQISQGNKIFGYCKISDNKDITRLFKHEQDILSKLNKQGIDNIPQCLYYGEIKENIYLFVQSTIKSNNSKVVHEWTEKHWGFISKLHQNTRVESIFEDTDFAKSLDRLIGYLDQLPTKDAHIIAAAIDEIKGCYKNQKVAFSAYHADFTPWNMFFEKEDLFVFDFEYAELTYPPYLDWFHFFTQTAIFEKHQNSDAIYQSYVEQEELLKLKINNVHILYISYLLDIIERYISRDKDHLSINTKEMLSIWVALLSKL